jgi:hypothetical protein
MCCLQQCYFTPIKELKLTVKIYDEAIILTKKSLQLLWCSVVPNSEDFSFYFECSHRQSNCLWATYYSWPAGLAGLLQLSSLSIAVTTQVLSVSQVI